MDSAIIYDQKRHRLERRARVFKYIPYLDSVYIAGSMALGNASQDSDFDVIVVTQPGRLYTCRFFALLLFTLLGWRRLPWKTKDGFCLSHFTTNLNLWRFDLHRLDLGLSDNHRLYAEKLEESLVPFYVNNRTSDVQDINVNIGTSDVPIIEKTLRWWQQDRIRQQISQWQRPEIPSRLVVNDQEAHLCFRLRTLDI